MYMVVVVVQNSHDYCSPLAGICNQNYVELVVKLYTAITLYNIGHSIIIVDHYYIMLTKMRHMWIREVASNFKVGLSKTH